MRFVIYVIIVLYSFSATADKQNSSLAAVAWMQDSAEYFAITQQTLKLAAKQIKIAKDDKRWTAALEQFPQKDIDKLPTAVILNLDDTMISSMPYHAELINDNDPHTIKAYEKWIAFEKAPLIAGIMPFIQEAAQNRVKVVIISNRNCIPTPRDKCPIKTQTLNMFKRAGLVFDRDDLLFKGEQPDWRKDKQTRREYLSKMYRILLIIGDDIADMIPNSAISPSPSRKMYTEQYLSLWGERWFLLPNPVSGSWREVAGRNLHDVLKKYD
ncbi:HAD family acid phosphatase [Algibacillus agarilyticus]|uniref:HAD family acid phosphatase n=1 Tax=Algibacillus agarilyticus TaxID=2234133 RepID=UPI000DD065AF|nr:HAD family acid phosphatase [Algibacillus agarilyticus]